MSCGADCRCSSDPALLWLLCRPAAVAPIQPQDWEPPYAMGVALKRQKNQKKKNAGEDVEKRESSYTVCGKVNWYNHHGKQYGVSLEK